MYRKILSFIYYKNKFLLLKNKSSLIHGKSKWFVVTGGCEKYESLKKAVIREIKEETNLKVLNIIPLNEYSIYEDYKKRKCKEYMFLSFVLYNKVILNEEHINYKWVDLDNFINLLYWEDNKILLKNKLLLLVNKFNK